MEGCSSFGGRAHKGYKSRRGLVLLTAQLTSGWKGGFLSAEQPPEARLTIGTALKPFPVSHSSQAHVGVCQIELKARFEASNHVVLTGAQKGGWRDRCMCGFRELNDEHNRCQPYRKN